MADHGVNRRRSHHARKRQRRGQHKKGVNAAHARRVKAYWTWFWTRPLTTKKKKKANASAE